MKRPLSIFVVVIATAMAGSSSILADHHKKPLFPDAVVPVLAAKCAGCHGEEKQKGKLRLDSLEAILKGGSEGASVVPGKVGESSLIQRILLPADDDERMPPEGKDQLTKEEIALLNFWVKSGASGDATIEALKPDEATSKIIQTVLANLPKGERKVAKTASAPALTDEQKKAVADAVAAVEKTGASLMPIAQDTPELRFSALNVYKDFDDKKLDVLKPVAAQIRWLDLARTQITDASLEQLGAMENLTRLHLEKTKITDAGLEHLKSLDQLEYLNLYGTGVTDAGIQKLSGLRNLKKLFVWQSKVTDAGAKKLAAALPGIDINTGWKASATKVVEVVKNETEKKAATPKPKPVPNEPKPAPKPAPAPKKEATPAPAAAKPAAGSPLDTALTELKKAAAETKKAAAEAKSAASAATAKAEAAIKEAEAAKARVSKAEAVAKETQAALDQLLKAVQLSEPTPAAKK